MLTKKNQTGRMFLIILALILLIQLAALVTAGTEKKSYHIDEIYTYILSNSYDANRISHDTKAMTSWNAGAYFDKFVEVEAGERFAYGSVKYNNSLDAHPPLYYYLIHTVSSLFPGSFTKWVGLGLNFLLFVGIQIVLYLLVSEVTGKKLCGVAAVALNGGLASTMDMMLFTRMYALLTFFAVLLVYVHYHLYLAPQKKRLYLLAAVITFLGVYTQYYFAFLAFFVAVACCLWLLKNREFKLLVMYALLMLAAVALVFLLYPAAVTQITGSETNNIGNEVSANIFNFGALPAALVKMVAQIIQGALIGFYHYWVLSGVCILTTLVASVLLRKRESTADYKNDLGRLLLLLGAILVLTVITITHISGKFTYVRYVYYLFPLFAALAIMLIAVIAPRMHLHFGAVCVGLICFGLIGAVSFAQNDVSTYLFQQKHKNESEIVELCQDRPLVLISNGSTYHPTANFEILHQASEVYICNYREDVDMDEILRDRDTGSGVVFMVLTDREWSEGFDGDAVMAEIIESADALERFELCGYSDFSTVYLAK